jgi:dipeptidase E
MKLYLSSYGIGNDPAKLKKILPKNRKTAYIPNALDPWLGFPQRKKHEKEIVAELESVGMEVDTLDLRDYFGKRQELGKKLREFGVVWVNGGNTFVLRQAMKLSGLDSILKRLAKTDKILYGGFSAGACVLSPSLRGTELADDPKADPYKKRAKPIWDGLGLIDYEIVPHYKSRRKETFYNEKELDYYIENKIPHAVLRDGEVIVTSC